MENYCLGVLLLDGRHGEFRQPVAVCNANRGWFAVTSPRGIWRGRRRGWSVPGEIVHVRKYAVTLNATAADRRQWRASVAFSGAPAKQLRAAVSAAHQRAARKNARR